MSRPKLINPGKTHIPCWLIWATSESGLVTLMAIALTPQISDQYRKLLAGSGKYVKVRVESTEANHLFEGSLDELWWEMYGQTALDRTEKLMLDVAQGERDLLKDAFRRLWEAIVQYLGNENRRELASTMNEIRLFLEF